MAKTLDERGAAWVRSLSDEDKQLLRDHAIDASPPREVLSLLNRGPAAYWLMGWRQSGEPWVVFMNRHITDHL